MRDIYCQFEIEQSDENENYFPDDRDFGVNSKWGVKRQKTIYKSDSISTFANSDFEIINEDKVKMLTDRQITLSLLKLFELFLPNELIDYTTNETLLYGLYVKNESAFRGDVAELQSVSQEFLYSLGTIHFRWNEST